MVAKTDWCQGGVRPLVRQVPASPARAALRTPSASPSCHNYAPCAATHCLALSPPAARVQPQLRGAGQRRVRPERAAVGPALALHRAPPGGASLQGQRNQCDHHGAVGGCSCTCAWLLRRQKGVGQGRATSQRCGVQQLGRPACSWVLPGCCGHAQTVHILLQPRLCLSFHNLSTRTQGGDHRRQRGWQRAAV